MEAERRRILYVQPNSEVGGSDIALLRTVAALDPQRFAPIVVLPAEGPVNRTTSLSVIWKDFPSFGT